MRLILLFFLGIFLLGSSPAQAETSEFGPESEWYFGPEHRQQIYGESKLSYGRAVGYSLLLPGAGNVYAEQYFTAGLHFSALLFSLVFMGYGLTTSQSHLVLGGGLLWGGAMLTSSVSGSVGVARYNERLRRQLRVGPTSLRMEF